MKELTGKQRLFALEYLKDRNMAQAAIRAGYNTKNANVMGNKIFQLPHVKAFITERVKRVEEQLEFQAIDVLREMWKIASADIRKAFDANGNLLPVHQLPDEIAQAIQSIDEDELFDGAGQDRRQIGVTHKVRMHPKVESLVALGKYFKLWTDKHEVGVDEDAAEILERVSAAIDKAQAK